MIKRLSDTLVLTEEQQSQVVQIFRDTGMAIRGLFQGDTPEDQRREMIQELRAKSAYKISLLLNTEQLKKYRQIQAETATGDNQRGRVWVLDKTGTPQPIEVVSGISDGTMTEVVRGELADHTKVIVGLASRAGSR